MPTTLTPNDRALLDRANALRRWDYYIIERDLLPLADTQLCRDLLLNLRDILRDSCEETL